MSCAVTNGMATSMTTSPVTMMGVAMAARLYSRMLAMSVLSIEFLPSIPYFS
ncbi:unknown [Collinsella sp. CAG:398]|nr:unknown [Collinsella sp. CAG:398]